MSQLPGAAVGTAVGVLFYSFFCEICNIIMVWLLLVHEEGFSYVACISYFTLLSTTCSIIQQFHDYIFWEDVVTAQFNYKNEHVGNPQLTLANGSLGVDLVLFYIQFYCYTVEATFVLFWAFSLTQSVYGWADKPRWRRLFKKINAAGKIVSIVLPLLTVCLLQVPMVQSSFVGFIVLADIEFALSCFGGCIFLVMILIRYIHTRRMLKTWSHGYGKKSSTTGTTSNGPQSSGGGQRPRSQGIYDRWLLIRFTIAFIFLAIFEVTNIIFQITAQKNNNRDAVAKAPDLSAERAVSMMLFNIPGVTASLLAFVVFGTTRPFRERMWRTFVPACLQNRERKGRNNASNRISQSHPQYSSRESAAKQRSTSFKLSKGVDTAAGDSELQLADLRAPRTTYLDMDSDSESERSIPKGRKTVTTTITSAGSQV
ncbi:hypothetical protein PG990_009605 [Apiospora arundinis]|uniref:Glycoside hydrolase n=1 Tax=Apiospora arundinis TaxID=335852 RepID=A0ABR2IUG2_9PEZI